MAASIAGALAGGGGAGLLEGFAIKLETSGFGKAMTDIARFNKGWDNMNKQLAPAANLWNKVQGVIGKTLGIFKGLLAPLAIAGGLFIAFFLAGRAGRDVFGAFGSIIGAFSDVLVASLMPAIEPLLIALADLLPSFQAVFGTPEWAATMTEFGAALATLIQAAFPVFLELLDAAIQVSVPFISAISMIVIFFADLITAFREAGFPLDKLVALFLSLADKALPLLNALLEVFVDVLVPIIPVVADIVTAFADLVVWLDDIGILFPLIITWFALFVGFASPLLGLVIGVSLLVAAIKQLFDALEAVGGLEALSAVLAVLAPGAAIIGAITGVIPGFQEGGTVARTGLAVVHEGETFSGVGPGAAGAVGFPPIIFQGPVYFGTTDQATVEDFVDQVGEEMRRRMIAGVSTPR